MNDMGEEETKVKGTGDAPVLPSSQGAASKAAKATAVAPKVKVAGTRAQTIGPKKRPLDPKDPHGPRDPKDPGRWPLIRDKVCDHCGKLARECEHYAGLDIYCRYCQQAIEDVGMNGRTIYVYELASNPGTIYTQCDHMPCKQAFEKEHGLTNVK